ncbi:protein kinase [Trypanosoma theileri]|uniref:Protein kinase n=1 Tax=Trypanosoma theileri TaxID=67003 RepID=A0A1X0P5S2_9TRYP|nr:protein kinase [Trypanosoma theileri]ORC91993.1 protein kinase [Trypanosoma theileri]
MLELRIEKYAVFVDKVESVRQRIAQLSRWPPSPVLMEYKDVRISPRYLVLTTTFPVDVELRPLQHSMTEEDARVALQGILRALYALHSRHIVHGHLRLETLRVHPQSGNIILTHHVLPIDLFVPSSDVGREAWHCCAPEIKRNSAFDYSADIWALGAVFMQLVAPAGKVYETEDLLEVDVLSPDVMSLSPSAVSFVVQCLNEEAEARPTVAELLMHPFLTDKQEWPDSYESGSDDTGEEV